MNREKIMTILTALCFIVGIGLLIIGCVIEYNTQLNFDNQFITFRSVSRLGELLELLGVVFTGTGIVGYVWGRS